MLFHFLHAHPWHEITPGSNDARREALFDQITEALVGGIEVFRPNPGVIGWVRIARFIGSARVERKHVWIQTRDELDDVKALCLSVGGKLPELIGPMQPVAQSHPPRVTQPKKWRPIRVFQMPSVSRDTDRAMPKQRIAAGERDDLHRTFNTVQAAITYVAALASPSLRAGAGRCITHFPLVCSRPKSGHLPRRSGRIRENDVKRYVVEWIGMRTLGGKADFHRDIH